MSGKKFTIMREFKEPHHVPWAMIERHETQAQMNHNQSLAALNLRGGVSPGEFLAILADEYSGCADRNFFKMSADESLNLIKRLESLYKVAQQKGFEGTPSEHSHIVYKVGDKKYGLNPSIFQAWPFEAVDAVLSLMASKLGEVINVSELCLVINSYMPENLRLKNQGSEIELQNWLKSSKIVSGTSDFKINPDLGFNEPK